MRTRAQLLADINKDLPPGVDWAKGAMSYVQARFEKHSREAYEKFSLNKPMSPIPAEAGFEPLLTEATHYLLNFVHCVDLLKLPGRSKTLDVACGGGWFSHYLTRFGYEAHGFDIAEDFVTLARRRIAEDPNLSVSEDDLARRFFAHNIEARPLPAEHQGQFDAIILESCLHHFVDPIAALTHLAAALKPTGVMVLIEGENRVGPIKDEYMKVMLEFHTLERPYPREQLEEAMTMAGLPAYEFVAPAGGWMSARDPRAPYLVEIHREMCRGLNFTICARNEAALQRIFPWRADLAAQAAKPGVTASPNDAAPLGPPPMTAARILRGLKRRARAALARIGIGA